MGDWFATTAMNGTMFLAMPVALVAGLVSFFSPCVLPLVPGYLSYLTGLTGLEERRAARGRATFGAALFVLGFAAVFVSFGSLFGAVGFRLLAWQGALTTVLGILTVGVGLVFLGHVQWAQREWRPHVAPRVGLLSGPILGGTFALGWTPCLGPTLTAVLALSSTEATAGRGAILATAYSLGLGVPFIAAGACSDRMIRVSEWARRHRRAINVVGGVMLVLVGVALATGVWENLVFAIRGHILGFNTVI